MSKKIEIKIRISLQNPFLGDIYNLQFCKIILTPVNPSFLFPPTLNESIAKLNAVKLRKMPDCTILIEYEKKL